MSTKIMEAEGRNNTQGQEEGSDPSVGWMAIVKRIPEVNNVHQGYKVSHHGSETGHHAAIWPKLLINGAWAVLTPYQKGRYRLPTPSDGARICGLSADAYITARGTSTRYRHPNPTVQRQLREMEVNILEEASRQGHVRLRRPVNESGGDWSVELFGDACRLQDLLQST